MTLTYKLDLHKIKMNENKYLGQRLFVRKLLFRHIDSQTDSHSGRIGLSGPLKWLADIIVIITFRVRHRRGEMYIGHRL